MKSLEPRRSVNSLIASTLRKMKIKVFSEQDREDFIEWIWEAKGLIGSKDSYKTYTKKLAVNNLMVSIPCNALNLLSIQSGTNEVRVSQELPVVINKRINGQLSGNRFTVDWPYIKFDSPGPTEVKIVFQGIEVGEDGYPLVKDSHFTAITYFLGYWYWLGKDNVPRSLDPQALYQKWCWYCGQTRGNDAMANLPDRKHIGVVWNNIVHYQQEIDRN